MRPLALAAAAVAAATATACLPSPVPPHHRASAEPLTATAPTSPAPEAGRIRVVTAPRIRVVSMLDPTHDLSQHDMPGLPPGTSSLPAPHRGSPPLPAVRIPTDLRALVGFRDKRAPAAAIASLSDSLGGTASLLVFDRTDSDRDADLTALAISTDPRGVIEFLYLGGGVYRRGFVDPAHPTKHSDATGAVLNTYMRTGKRWPPKGTHYLAGELLARIINAP